MTQTDPYNLSGISVEYWDADKIKVYERNTKVHPKSQIEALKKAIKEVGLLNPLVLDFDGVIIAGHGRYQALCELGQVRNIPVRVARSLSKAQADAARIADNKTASTEYDSSFMAEELARLAETGEVDLTALGLDDHELEFLSVDIGAPDLNAFSDDLDGDVDKQDAETADKVAAADRSERPISKVLGFTVIPIAHERAFRGFISKIEAETGKRGVEAWIEYIDGAMAA